MQEFAYISGDIDTALLMKSIAKSGKHAELVQLDYGYNYNWTDYCSQKHQYNLHSHEMPSVQHQSSQDQTAPKSLENSAPATSTRPNKTKSNNSNCCLM